MDCAIPTIPISFMVRNALVREGLKHILVEHDFNVSRSISSVEEFVLAARSDDHILIYDGSCSISGDDLSGVKLLVATYPGTRIVLLVETFDFDLLNRAFLAGASGYILQDVSVECFVSMMQLVVLGQKVAPSELIDMLGAMSRPIVAPCDVAQTYRLAGREVEILNCLTMGMPNKMISRTLGLSEATVKLSVKGIFRKMAVTNRTQAAILAQRADRAAPPCAHFPALEEPLDNMSFAKPV